MLTLTTPTVPLKLYSYDVHFPAYFSSNNDNEYKSYEIADLLPTYSIPTEPTRTNSHKDHNQDTYSEQNIPSYIHYENKSKENYDILVYEYEHYESFPIYTLSKNEEYDTYSIGVYNDEEFLTGYLQIPSCSENIDDLQEEYVYEKILPE